MLSFDTAFKVGTDNDYFACTVWGATADKYYALYAWRGRAEFPELRRMVVGLVKQFRPSATLIEDSASGQPLIQELKRSPELKIVPVRPKGGKLSRAHSITPLIEFGAVLLPGPCPWREMFLEELLAFPNGVHDDLVDSATQALIYLRDTKWGGNLLELFEAAWGPTKHVEIDPYRCANMVELPEGYNLSRFAAVGDKSGELLIDGLGMGPADGVRSRVRWSISCAISMVATDTGPHVAPLTN